MLGLDETRRFNQMQKTAIGCYASAETVTGLRRMFDTSSANRDRWAAAFRSCGCSRSPGRSRWAASRSCPVPLFHGELPVLGFRVGPFAYLTDCNRIPDESWPLLMADGGIRVLILDALRERRHPTHFNCREALEVV